MFKHLAIIALILFGSGTAYSAEKITFMLGAMYRSVEVAELEEIIETGDSDGLVSQILSVGKMDNKEFIRMLTKPHKFSLTNMGSLTSSPFGRAILKKLGKAIFPRRSRANGDKALASAIVMSVADDGYFQVIEIIKNYPTDIGVDLVEAKKISEQMEDAVGL